VLAHTLLSQNSTSNSDARRRVIPGTEQKAWGSRYFSGMEWQLG
jgi:hypothetical protein